MGKNIGIPVAMKIENFDNMNRVNLVVDDHRRIHCYALVKAEE
jgi:hypothetical protein